MKVFQDYVTQGSWIAHKNMIIDNNISAISSYEKRRIVSKSDVFIIFSRQWGRGVDPRNPPPPRAYATVFAHSGTKAVTHKFSCS